MELSVSFEKERSFGKQIIKIGHQTMNIQRRNDKWKKAPRRIEAAECIGCKACVRSCPTKFRAIVSIGLDIVIIPELCPGCKLCICVCPMDCIYVDCHWQPTDAYTWGLVNHR